MKNSYVSLYQHFMGTLSCNNSVRKNQITMVLKVQIKCFFIAEFERVAKIRKIAVYRFLISLLVPELCMFKDE